MAGYLHTPNLLRSYNNSYTKILFNVFFSKNGAAYVYIFRKHRHSTRGAAPTFDAVARASVSFFSFLFFSSDSRRRGSIRAESASICVEPGWFGQNRVVLAILSRIWNRPKSTLNMAGKTEICLLLYFLCELRHSNVFFKNILIVKIYKKNIFNNFLIVESRRTCTLLFQKLPSPALAPESWNAPVLHRYIYIYIYIYLLWRAPEFHKQAEALLGPVHNIIFSSTGYSGWN